ncbi:MAG TPA: hypothetical protein VK213_05975 [Bacteroidales bacterium]|nr:hypothetical protein [Bacteroidales bacterium]
MKRTEKIELLKKIDDGTASVQDLQGYVIILEKDGKKFLSDREISDHELNQITTQKIFLVKGKRPGGIKEDSVINS